MDLSWDLAKVEICYILSTLGKSILVLKYDLHINTLKKFMFSTIVNWKQSPCFPKLLCGKILY